MKRIEEKPRKPNANKRRIGSLRLDWCDLRLKGKGGQMTTPQANSTSKSPYGSRVLKVIISLVLVAAQAGCSTFGASSMSSDIDAYNRHYLDSEKTMLLYNVGLLHSGQPPHFMMLSSVAQTRTFTASASFQ